MRHPGILRLRKLMAATVLCYAALAVGWSVAHRLVGDRFWLLGLANAFAVYLFAPLPLAALLAALARRAAAWVGVLTVLLLFGAHFGGELTPPLPAARADASTPSLTAMTYNVLFTTTDAFPIAASIRRANPDLIGFQELTPSLEQALAQEIGALYPHRTRLHPDQCLAEVSIWSRHPILAVEEVDPDVLCRVRPVVIDLDGHPVRAIAVHAWPYVGIDRQSVEQGFRWRQEQIELVLDMVEDKPEPLILLGDLNATPMSDVYRSLSARLSDAYREAGAGFGHTFPGQGGRWGRVPYPARLVRIDYVFHSSDWRATEAWVGAWDSVSDHHPVIARLSLQ